MKILTLLFLLLATVFFQRSQAQMPDSVRRFVDSALNIMQNNSIYAKQLNWKSIRTKTFSLSANAQTYQQTGDALRFAFNALNDKHGWLVLNDVDYRNPRFPPDTSRITQNIKDVAMKGPRIYTALVADQYAYVSIPFFGGQTTAGMNAFAQRIQDSLCKNISPRVKGIIIDLRLNAGGNMYPMLVGISNVLGDGVLSISRDNKGNIVGKTEMKNASLILLDTMIVKLQHTCGDLTKLPVAVIIGPVTGSAGECMAVALRGRKNTKLVGETTSGYTSSNQGYLLPGQNNGIVIGVDFLHDKNGKAYLENVQPDIRVTGGDDFFNHASDKKILAAVKWLKAQKN
ncbi:MAG: S41 family peptidase [Chitinophagaceae bacterium]